MSFSKAFGKIPHRRLMTKLDYYGIRGALLHWLEAWQRKWKRNLNLQSAKSYALQAREIHQSRNTYSVKKILEEVESHPYLGVALDDKMRWSLHIWDQ